MKAVEYRAMPEEQLALSLKETTKNLFHLRFQSATERLETPSEIGKAKREIARILTVQRERQLKAIAAKKAAEKAAAPAPKPAPAPAPKPAPAPAKKPEAPKAAAPTKQPATKAKPAKSAKKEK